MIKVQLLDSSGEEVASFDRAGPLLELSKKQLDQEAPFEYLYISVYKQLEPQTHDKKAD